jgi:hypothetical protein
MWPSKLQMAGSAEAFRPLAHDLHADESLVQERRSRSDIREVAVGADRADQGASGRDGRSKKNGPLAIGKSRGGWNTKVHLVAANARTAITFALSPGHAHDAPGGVNGSRREGFVWAGEEANSRFVASRDRKCLGQKAFRDQG